MKTKSRDEARVCPTAAETPPSCRDLPHAQPGPGYGFFAGDTVKYQTALPSYCFFQANHPWQTLQLVMFSRLMPPLPWRDMIIRRKKCSLPGASCPGTA